MDERTLESASAISEMAVLAAIRKAQGGGSEISENEFNEGIKARYKYLISGAEGHYTKAEAMKLAFDYWVRRCPQFAHKPPPSIP